jgi:hypothetical protein
MALRTVRMALSTIADGTGTVTMPNSRSGLIEAIELDFASGTDAGADTTVSCVNGAGAAVTLLTITDSKTDARYFPRALAHTAAGVAQTAYTEKIPFHGYLRLAIAQGGVTVANAVIATIFYST